MHVSVLRANLVKMWGRREVNELIYKRYCCDIIKIRLIEENFYPVVGIRLLMTCSHRWKCLTTGLIFTGNKAFTKRYFCFINLTKLNMKVNTFSFRYLEQKNWPWLSEGWDQTRRNRFRFYFEFYHLKYL